MATSHDRLTLAIKAASEVAVAQGLAFDRAIVLQDLSNVIVHLVPDVVARVATTTGTIRQGNGWFAREVAVANHLTYLNAPIIPTSDRITPGPHEHLGLVLSFWQFVRVFDTPCDPVLAGRSLRVCHRLLKSFSQPLSVLALIKESQEICAQLIADDYFEAADATMLRQLGEQAITQLSQYPMQPIHGDSHFGNVLNTADGVLWTDWEDVFWGPIEWDLASMVASSRVFGTDLAQAQAALGGYGHDYDPVALASCIEARTWVALIWTIVIQQQHPSAARQARIERRLTWLRSRE